MRRAVTFTHPGELIEHATDLDYSVLDDHELATIIDKLPERPLLAGEEGIRLSLAGAQDKLPVLVVDGRIALPLHGAPSSHILKPAIRRVADSVHNEASAWPWLRQSISMPLRRTSETLKGGRICSWSVMIEYNVGVIGRAVCIKRISVRRSVWRRSTNTRTRAAPP